MAKSGAKLLGAWIVGAVFVAFSGAVALSWLYKADLWVSRTVQEHPSDSLRATAEIFSLPGSLEVSVAALLVLLAALFLRGRHALAGWLLAVFMITGIVELVMKLYLPQASIPQESLHAEDFAPLVAASLPYPYPSGHMLRGVILLGALYLLSGNKLFRAGIFVLLLGLAASRVYMGVHWATDVVGGALLGIAALLWLFGKEGRRRWRSP
jgi:undecaprenyl-diphosphatase